MMLGSIPRACEAHEALHIKWILSRKLVHSVLTADKGRSFGGNRRSQPSLSRGGRAAPDNEVPAVECPIGLGKVAAQVRAATLRALQRAMPDQSHQGMEVAQQTAQALAIAFQSREAP